MIVRCPRKPSSRSASAARSPASDAPTMMMRPDSLKPAIGVLIGTLLLAAELVHDDRLYRARRRRSQHPQTLTVVRVGVVGQRLVAAELEHIRRQRYAVRVAQATVQVDNDSHSDLDPRSARSDAGSVHPAVMPNVRVYETLWDEGTESDGH